VAEIAKAVFLGARPDLILDMNVREFLLLSWWIKGGGTIPVLRLPTLLRDERSRRRLGSELDRRAGAENLTRTVFGPHGDVRIGGLHQHGRLEAVPGNRFYWF
jgi:hypothetical protein